MRLSELAQRLQARLLGDDVEVSGIRSLQKASPRDVGAILHPRDIRLAYCTKAAAVICSLDNAAHHANELLCSLLVCEDPNLAYIEAIQLFCPIATPPSCLISPRAFIHPTAQIGANTQILPFSYIDENVRIGDNCVIGVGAVILRKTTIGKGVLVGHNSVIGKDGFVFAASKNQNIRVPHVGGVVIGDDVEIGANVCIDRGVLEDTIISCGTKIDNLVQIAHDVEIGNDGVIAALSGIAGDTVVGARVLMGGQVGVADHVRIGDDVVIKARGHAHGFIKNSTIIDHVAPCLT